MKRKHVALVFCTLVLLVVSASVPAASRPDVSVSKLFVDKINGETTIWVPWEYYDSMIYDRWGNIVCIAPSHNVNDMLCDELDLVDFFEDDQGNFFVKLSYNMVTGQGFSGFYPYRGYNHGLWFGLPCSGGHIKGFLYPDGNPFPFVHVENMTSLPSGDSYVC